MKKGDLIELLKDVPDSYELFLDNLVYVNEDLYDFYVRDFRINIEKEDIKISDVKKRVYIDCEQDYYKRRY